MTTMHGIRFCKNIITKIERKIGKEFLKTSHATNDSEDNFYALSEILEKNGFARLKNEEGAVKIVFVNRQKRIVFKIDQRNDKKEYDRINKIFNVIPTYFYKNVQCQPLAVTFKKIRKPPNLVKLILNYWNWPDKKREEFWREIMEQHLLKNPEQEIYKNQVDFHSGNVAKYKNRYVLIDW